MQLLIIIVAIFLAFQFFQNKGPSEDECYDLAYDACESIGKKKCGLSNYDSSSEWDACRPFSSCESSVFSECMDED